MQHASKWKLEAWHARFEGVEHMLQVFGAKPMHYFATGTSQTIQHNDIPTRGLKLDILHIFVLKW